MALSYTLVCIALLFSFVQLSYSNTPSSFGTCNLTPSTGTPFNGTATFTCGFNIGSSSIGGTVPSFTWSVLLGRSFNPSTTNPTNTDFVPISISISSGSCNKSQTATNMFQCGSIRQANDPNSVTLVFNVNDAIRATNWTFQAELTNSYDNSVFSPVYALPLLQPKLAISTNPSDPNVLSSYIAGDTVPLSLTVQNTGQSSFNCPVTCLITFNSGLTPSGSSVPAGCSIISLNSAQCTTANYYAAGASTTFSFNATYSGGAASGSILNISCQDTKLFFPAQIKTLSIGGTQSPSISPTISVSPSVSSTPVASGASLSSSPAPSTANDGSSQGTDGTDGNDGTDGDGGSASSKVSSWLSVIV